MVESGVFDKGDMQKC